MLHHAEFYLGLHCFPKYLFRGLQFSPRLPFAIHFNNKLSIFFPFTATEENLNNSDLADPESIPDSAPPVDLVEITVPKNKHDKKYVSYMLHSAQD